MRNKIIAGNWKMNTNLLSAVQLAAQISNGFVPIQCKIILFPPFPFILEVQNIIHTKTEFFSGAQDLSPHEKGAYTGDVSAEMIVSTGAQYVLVGHSERRQYHQESDELLYAKILMALKHGLKVIFCCGESLDIREQEKHKDFVANQLRNVIMQLSPEQMEFITIAYEPIWAIGTGVTASPIQAQEMHAAIRNQLANHFGEVISRNTSLIYGGSVNATNANELFAQHDIDGALIGGASLKAEEFMQIAITMENTF